MPTIMLAGRFRRTNHSLLTLRLKRHNVFVSPTFNRFIDAVAVGTNPGMAEGRALKAQIPVIGPRGLDALLNGADINHVIWNAIEQPQRPLASSTVLAQLRSILHNAPTEEIWHQIVGLLDRTPSQELEIAVQYAKAHMEHWPLATAPKPSYYEPPNDICWSLPWPQMDLLGRPTLSWLRGLALDRVDRRFELLRAIDFRHLPATIRAANTLEMVLRHPSLTGLRALFLRSYDVDGSHADSFAQSTSPIELLIYQGNTGISEAVLRTWLEGGLPHLRRLDLHLHQLSVPRRPLRPFRPLEAFCAGPSLRPDTLDIYAHVLSSTQHISALHSGFQGGPQVRKLVRALNPEVLKSLDLSHIVVGRRGTEALLEQRWPQLRHLRLRNSNLSTRAGEYFHRMARLPQLEGLDLHGNALYQRGVVGISQAELPALKWLNLSSCLRSADLLWLCNPALASLKGLGLAHNAIDACSVIRILATRPERAAHLEVLDLRGSSSEERRIVDTLVQHRQALPNLRRIGLSLRHRPISPTSIRLLRDAFPQLTPF
ncbi:MAG: hypothetical protein AAFX99_15435 [Myxococcota bacterium]